MCQSKSEGGRRCPLHTRGTRAILAAVRVNRDLDRDQADVVFKKAYRQAKPRSTPPSPQAWSAFLNSHIERLALDANVDANDFDRLARKLHAARHDIPDPHTFAALRDMERRSYKAVNAVRRQIDAAAALRGVDPDTVTERFHAYRAQWRNELRHLPREQRPIPPEEWVEGFTKKDMMAVSTPADPATLYALYRCQADPDAYPSTGKRGYASIDLETAGPAGRAGFEPQNGSIIEVAIVEYDADGNETDRYSQLVAPAPQVAATCGTGAVEVHGITMDDLTDAPTWTQVAPQIAERLHGRALLAQNARFEQEWLNHHMTSAGHDFDRWGPTVDTMCIARQHHPNLPNHQLATICNSVGVNYSDGHRALHDAEVAGRAFFALRRQITTTYLASPQRAAAPQPPLGYGAPRRRSQMTRITGGTFNPSQVRDPWTQPLPGADTAVA